MSVSPTAEGFRVALRRPSLTLAEIAWRWTAGATAAAVLAFGLAEYLDTLPVTNGDLLFLRTRHPYLVSEAIAHILRGSVSRGMAAVLLAALLLMMLWIVAASVGRIAVVRSLLDYFRRDAVNDALTSTNRSPFPALMRLNFLRAAVALASVFALIGASIFAGFVSPNSDPQPGLVFFLFFPLAAMVGLAGWSLNWLLSLAGMLAVRDEKDAMDAIASAVTLCRERAGRVFAVSSWTGLAHLVAFVGAGTVALMPIGFAGVVPWRLVVAVMILVTLVYFALADWLYMARLAGYVFIVEMPEALLSPPPVARPKPPTVGPAVPLAPLSPAPIVATTIDRDESILSDAPNPAVETSSTVSSPTSPVFGDS